MGLRNNNSTRLQRKKTAKDNIVILDKPQSTVDWPLKQYSYAYAVSSPWLNYRTATLELNAIYFFIIIIVIVYKHLWVELLNDSIITG